MLQPSKLKPDTFWRTSSGTTSQPDAEGGTRPRSEPAAGRLVPPPSHNALLSTSDANRTPSASQTDAPRTNTFRDASAGPADGKESGPTRSSRIQPSAAGKPGPTLRDTSRLNRATSPRSVCPRTRSEPLGYVCQSALLPRGPVHRPAAASRGPRLRPMPARPLRERTRLHAEREGGCVVFHRPTKGPLVSVD